MLTDWVRYSLAGNLRYGRRVLAKWGDDEIETCEACDCNRSIMTHYPVSPLPFLRGFPLECYDGEVRRGGESLAHGLVLAYGELPHENVSFIGCHDNMTSFDTVGMHLWGSYCVE